MVSPMLNDLIGEDPDDAIVDRRVRPALLSLLYDQVELVDADVGYDLRTGFKEVSDLIEWYQRANVRTLGNLAAIWPPTDCISDETLLAATVRDAPAETFPEWKAREYRRLLEDEAVKPACREAYQSLRDSATEYVKSDDDDDSSRVGTDLDPTKQGSVAMRPGFSSLDDQQAAVLEELWGGFESRYELDDWLHSLNSPTFGEIDDDLPRQVMRDEVALDYLIYERETEKAEMYRYTFATTVLLPNFVAAVRAIETAELAKAAQDGPVTLRQGTR